MKPITLTVAGLHSFREKQTIDFEALCEGGVFGIFGPTGSGKSSILDAMTLALYGKVERASNNTQGIMNHAENVVDVSYLFELENAKGKKRFKVERTFKRTDDIRVKSGISRLTEIKDEEHIVLADKANEVNAKIHDIIGLTIDDFTRAVVLPQGKFAEFLSLKGADRRQMLQRLFQLERFGDQLSRKIKEELQEKTQIIGELEAEQLGLGEASNEAVKVAEQAYEEIQSLVVQAEKTLSDIEATFEIKKKIWEWQEERKPVEASLANLRQEEKGILELEEKVSVTEQAEALKPLLDDLKEVEKALSQWKKKQTDDKKAQTSAKELFLQKSRLYEEARERKGKELPLLLSKKEKLERALKLEESIIPQQQKLYDLKGKISAAMEKHSSFSQAAQKANDLYVKAVNKQKLLKEELATISITEEQLEYLQQANEQKQTMVQLEKSSMETGNEAQKHFENFSKFDTEMNQARMQLETEKNKLLSLFQATEKYYHRSGELALSLDLLETELENYQKEEQKQADDLKVQQLALELAKSLEAGKACPVCGSKEHPGHSGHEGFQEVATAKEMTSFQPPSISQQKQENLKLKIKLEQIASDLFKELEESHELPQPKDADKIMADWKKEMAQASDAVELLTGKFEQISTDQKGLLQDILELQEKKELLMEKVRSLKNTAQENERLSQTYKHEWQSWNKKHEQYSSQWKKQRQQWDEQYPDIPFDHMEDVYHQAKQAEKQRTDLQNRINKSVDYIEERGNEVKEHESKIGILERELYEAKLLHEQLQSRLDEIEKEINDLAGETRVSEEWKKVENAMKQLNSAESSCYQDFQSSQEQLHHSEKQASQSERMVEEFNLRAQKLHEKWSSTLEDSSFSSMDEVEENMLQIPSKHRWKQQIADYWDQKKAVEKDLQRLNKLIGSDVLLEQEWKELQQNLQDTRQELRTAVEKKSATAQHLSSVKERNARFLALEKKKIEVKEAQQLFQKLQHAFRGNSFVEYLAEEQLQQISREASERLGQLTRQRYALEMDSQGGFVIRDDANGGVRRPVSTLSGGETFLTSLALALSLSAQIQLRGEYPLQFFFLDEGFGTLDSELLDAVVTSLERLQSNHLAVGVISHVQELRARLSKRLMVTPAEASGKGSTVKLESL
ncbi:Nuclease SbcCD subunit C [Bacillus sp. THAF10]|uniref:SbcC/MukB-like Walker B domain-containing protein n=1 Tax=Bacillus sp. THAF10 TaxID=2587848 RepID=UPI0012693292|nr:SMC family ATPase [Bacillus sp. THAF10]QFT88310.1 Nuclease SbcCD subunit C [Bacillus sp. THAF10]